jgi:ubiquinone/menaquinone biosynthesis C-methylase UbiE
MIPDGTTSAQTTQSATEEYYKDYDARKGADRNDLLRNPEVLFQFLALEASVIRALASVQPDPAKATVLDVGCGEGLSLLPLLRVGFTPSNLYGVDIRPEQIASARSRFPTIHFECTEASQLSFPDRTFDIVQESTMFLQMTDDGLAKKIAAEMVRVTKPGGHILLSDWRYSRPGTPEFKAVNKERITHLFSVGTDTSVERVVPGCLIPPVGRFLSKNLPALYFPVRAVFPFLAGQVTTVLKKLSNG